MTLDADIQFDFIKTLKDLKVGRGIVKSGVSPLLDVIGQDLPTGSIAP